MRVFTAIIALTVLSGCTEVPPKPFVTGKDVMPPYGCIEARKRDANEPC